MNEMPKQRWGYCFRWGIVVGGLLTVYAILVPGPHPSPLHGFRGRSVSNCKQIILALHFYAKDAKSFYPDKPPSSLKSANQVFRELIKEQIVSDESIFGSRNSVFEADHEIGVPPNYENALAPGECHWMLLKYQSLLAHPKTPLVIENSFRDSWPPKWDVKPFEGVSKRGQAWRGREIIIGRNDGSVAVEKLREDGTMDWHSSPNLDEHGKSWIDYLTPEEVAKLSYWDIEEK